jgi:hypothetical protein
MKFPAQTEPAQFTFDITRKIANAALASTIRHRPLPGSHDAAMALQNMTTIGASLAGSTVVVVNGGDGGTQSYSNPILQVRLQKSLCCLCVHTRFCEPTFHALFYMSRFALLTESAPNGDE